MPALLFWRKMFKSKLHLLFSQIYTKIFEALFTYLVNLVTISFNVAPNSGYKMEELLSDLGVLKSSRWYGDLGQPTIFAPNIKWAHNHLFIVVPGVSTRTTSLATTGMSKTEYLEDNYAVVYVVTLNKDKTLKLFRDLTRSEEGKKYTSMATYGEGGETIYFRRLEIDPTADKVILCPDLKDTLDRDIHRFLSSKSLYDSRGIDYKRGYLLYGPPGNGKTSIVKHFANKYQLDVGIFSSKCLNARSMWNAIRNLGSYKTIWLFEDIDAFFTGRSGTHSNMMDFSEFINLLDGVNAPVGRIVFMTTNYIENIDEALFRPGRIDRIFEIKKATKYQAEKLFCKIYPGSDEYAAIFSQKIEDYKYSMAELECKIISAGNALEALKSLDA